MPRPLNSRTIGEETYLTPPELIKSLGHFTLDPCSPIGRPWDTAEVHLTVEDDGLLLPWFGRVWLNPPYGSQLPHWLGKMAMHGNGIALVFARTDTRAFHNYVFPHARSILFMEGRIKFYDINGIQAQSNGGAPSVLISYTDFDAEMIDESGLKGAHISLAGDVFIFGIENKSDVRTWKIIVGEAFQNLSEKATLEDIYEAVVSISPQRVKNNRHYKAKVRQTLQRYHTRVERGVYSA